MTAATNPGDDQPVDPSDELSYEAARAELADVMRSLESGGQSLEESLELWRRGEELADVCQGWLNRAAADLDRAIAERTTSSPSQ